MGRYITGDIEHKFWFGVQSSDDADFFGVSGEEPSTISYYYSGGDLAKVEEGIATCKEKLGSHKKRLDDFFEKHVGYNDQMLIDEGLDPSLLEWYARLNLGEKIARCIEQTGQCEFEAEL